MNQRIRELLAQSGLEPRGAAQQGQIEKFAQLIIQECVTACRVKVVVDNDYNDGRMDCARDIKQHFGVKF